MPFDFQALTESSSEVGFFHKLAFGKLCARAGESDLSRAAVPFSWGSGKAGAPGRSPGVASPKPTSFARDDEPAARRGLRPGPVPCTSRDKDKQRSHL